MNGWGYPVMTLIRHKMENGRSLCGLKVKTLWPDLRPAASGGGVEGCGDCKTCTRILERRNARKGGTMIGYISKRDWEALQAGKTKMPMILDEAGLKQWQDHMEHCGGAVRIEVREIVGTRQEG